MGTITAWQPERNRIFIATLGKLAEECNELAGRATRCIIQGVVEPDPETGRANVEELRREIADVRACIVMAEHILGFSFDVSRADEKLAGYRQWHELIKP